jgi:hypothetical protein
VVIAIAGSSDNEVCTVANPLYLTFGVDQEGKSSAFNRKYSTDTSKKKGRFDSFDKQYKITHQNAISEAWLSWFVGFAEGDGAILTDANGRRTFVLTQKERDVLDIVQKTFNFGTVKEFQNSSGPYYRWLVGDAKSIILLALLFNGNLVLEHRVKQLGRWLLYLNPILHKHGIAKPIILDSNRVLPTLNDGWLSGFIDAEGCFNLLVSAPRTATARFILDQKDGLDLFDYLKILLNGGTVRIRYPGMYNFKASALSSHFLLESYLTTYPLRSKKQFSFVKWIRACRMIKNKHHLFADGWAELDVLKKQINPKN